MPAELLRQFEEFLSGQGMRLTGRRRLIADTFFRSRGHLSADEIYLETRKSDPRLGPATVYRTLKLLRQAGLASGMTSGEGLARYEPPSRRGHHDHLICRGCGRIVEFENDQIEALQDKVARSHGFVVTDHRLELYGVCGVCRKAGR